nr:(Fe-S)-binding protein [Ardenticatena sp.]
MKRIALFVTCLVDQFMPDIGVATVRLLRAAGCEVVFPEEQTCCGQPFFNSGFRPEARRLAERTVACFERFDAVVAPSGSCTTMLRVEYPHLLDDRPGWAHRARELAAKTYELSEFLIDVLDWKPPRRLTGQRVAYHDSCHMCRLLMLREPPREALRRAGYEIVEMQEPDRCCGFGGLFSIRMPEVSNAMTTEKLLQAEATGADVLATADPGCLMQMRGLARDGVRVAHIAPLLAATLEA